MGKAYEELRIQISPQSAMNFTPLYSCHGPGVSAMNELCNARICPPDSWQPSMSKHTNVDKPTVLLIDGANRRILILEKIKRIQLRQKIVNNTESVRNSAHK